VGGATAKLHVTGFWQGHGVRGLGSKTWIYLDAATYEDFSDLIG